MDDVAIISDLHYKLGRGNNLFIKHVEDAVDNFIEECNAREVKKVLILGDVFHVKQSIDTYCLNRCLKSIRKITSLYPTTALVGNHDSIRRNNHDINLMNVFSSDCNVITDYEYEDIDGVPVRFHYLPFFEDDTLRKKINEIQIRPNAQNIMYGHFSFDGYGPAGHEEVYSSLKPKDIINCGIDYIYSGHVHSYKSDSNFTYVSSPLESHFNEGGIHGYVFHNYLNAHVHEFIVNDLSPKFIEFTLKKSNLKNLYEIKDSYVSIILKKKLDQHLVEALKRKVEEKNHYVRIVSNVEIENNDISVIQGWDNYILMSAEEIIEDYANKVLSDNDEHTADELIEEIFRI